MGVSLRLTHPEDVVKGWSENRSQRLCSDRLEEGRSERIRRDDILGGVRGEGHRSNPRVVQGLLCLVGLESSTSGLKSEKLSHPQVWNTLSHSSGTEDNSGKDVFRREWTGELWEALFLDTEATGVPDQGLLNRILRLPDLDSARFLR